MLSVATVEPKRFVKVFVFMISIVDCLWGVCYNYRQRAAAWCSAGFTAQTLIRSRNFKYTTNVDTKNVAPHCTKPMLSVRPSCLYVVCRFI